MAKGYLVRSGSSNSRRTPINTVFLNNFTNALFDTNMAKSSYPSQRMELDSVKQVGGKTTGKLLYSFHPVDLYTFKKTHTQWTIEYWIYPTSYSGSYKWFTLLNSSGSTILQLRQSGANAYTEWTGTSYDQVFTNPANNTPHHLAITYDNETIKLYWDGVLKNTFTLTINSLGHTISLANNYCTSTNLFRFRVSKTLRYTANFTPETDLLSVD